MSIYPHDRVFTTSEKPTIFTLSKNTQYTNIFTEKEKLSIVAKYRNPNTYNGNCIRLESLENKRASLSICDFYSFLCCNMSGIYNHDSIAYEKLKPHLNEIKTFNDVLKIKELPNIIGVSVLLKDCNGDFLVTERNITSTNSSGLFACSAGGTLEVNDLNHENPLIYCGKRELKEELNLDIDLELKTIVIAKQKMQPIALLSGKIDGTWDSIIDYIKQGKDFQNETSRLLIIPRNKILQFIFNCNLTDAAAYHLFLSVGGNKKQWNVDKRQFFNVNNYYS